MTVTHDISFAEWSALTRRGLLGALGAGAASALLPAAAWAQGKPRRGGVLRSVNWHSTL